MNSLKVALPSLIIGLSILFQNNAKGFNVVFNVDMTNETVSEFGVHIVGNFQDLNPSLQSWNPSAYPLLDDDNDGIYSITLELDAGECQYLFINGNDWPGMEAVPLACSNGFSNRITNISGNTTYTACFSNCSTCNSRYVTFSLDVNYLDYNGDFIYNSPTDIIGGIRIQGNFQDWITASQPLTDDDGDGIWTGTFDIGNIVELEYRFLNGTNTINAEPLPASCQINGYRYAHIPLNENNTILPIRIGVYAGKRPFGKVIFPIAMNGYFRMPSIKVMQHM